MYNNPIFTFTNIILVVFFSLIVVFGFNWVVKSLDNSPKVEEIHAKKILYYDIKVKDYEAKRFTIIDGVTYEIIINKKED